MIEKKIFVKGKLGAAPFKWRETQSLIFRGAALDIREALIRHIDEKIEQGIRNTIQIEFGPEPDEMTITEVVSVEVLARAE